MSNFKIGVIADGLRMPFRESTKKCSQMGLDGVQLYAVSGEMAPENMPKQDIVEKRSILDGFGLEISALCGDLGGYGFAVEKDNPSKIEKSKRIVDLALELGSNIVTTHIGVIPSDKSSKTYGTMQAACNELAGYAYDRGAYFAIETGPEPALLLKEFLDSLDTKGVAVNLDPANFVMVTGDDPVEAVHTLKDYIVHTHAKDGIMLQKTDPKIIYDFFAQGGIGDLRLDEYFKELPLGQGDVDFEAYLAALRDINFNGYLTIERETGSDPAKDIKLAVSFLKELISR
ncbi:MAG TPA: sugar phosphate isomerase/epimerase [Bacillota bacterium]|nr:sugar phosphate isomerase/epimerase [Bacillota bacterium]